MCRVLYCYLAILIFGSLNADEFPPKDLLEEVVAPIHNLCVNQMGVSDDDVKNYDIDQNVPDMKCYMRCLMISGKWMREDGDIDYPFIEDSAHPSIKDILIPALNKCRGIEKLGDKCETAYVFNLCLRNADTVHWFLP